MASKYSHDVCFGQPIKDSDKKRWIKIGAAFTDEQGRLSIKLDCVPLGVDPARGCWLSLFEAKPRESGQTEHGAAKANAYQSDGGDVPF
jgi:hypothetical protein